MAGAVIGEAVEDLVLDTIEGGPQIRVILSGEARNKESPGVEIGLGVVGPPEADGIGRASFVGLQ